jgi:hypothetical protein
VADVIGGVLALATHGVTVEVIGAQAVQVVAAVSRVWPRPGGWDHTRSRGEEGQTLPCSVLTYVC